MDASLRRRRRRVVIGRGLLATAAVAATVASAAELAGLSAVEPDVAMLAGWRALGLGVFAGAFALLAWRPMGYPGLLELAVGHKLALTVYALAKLGTSTDAPTVAVADGLLTLGLVTAYVLLRAHRAWSPERRQPTGSSDVVASGSPSAPTPLAS